MLPLAVAGLLPLALLVTSHGALGNVKPLSVAVLLTRVSCEYNVVDMEPVNPCKLLTTSELRHKSFLSSQQVCRLCNG